MGSSTLSSMTLLILVFYCFAAILPAAGIYSIISLFISGLLLNVFRPILRENASAVPYNGGSYSYLVNFTSKYIAIIAAAITSLDAITTVTSRVSNQLISGGGISRKCRRLLSRRSPLAILGSFVTGFHLDTIFRCLYARHSRIQWRRIDYYFISSGHHRRVSYNVYCAMGNQWKLTPRRELGCRSTWIRP